MYGKKIIERNNGIIRFPNKIPTRQFDLDFRNHMAIQDLLDLNGFTDFFEIFEKGNCTINGHGYYGFLNINGVLKGYSKIAKKYNLTTEAIRNRLKVVARLEYQRYKKIECPALFHMRAEPALIEEQ